HRLDGVRSRGLHGGQEAEEHAREGGDPGGEDEQANGAGRLDEPLRVLRAGERDERAGGGLREGGGPDGTRGRGDGARGGGRAGTRLSGRSWRISRRRDAPSARRTAISRCRALARAIMRFAMFAQAIRRTRAEMPSSRKRGSE